MKAKLPFAHTYWFPLAALYSALILPLSVGGQLCWFTVPAGLQYAWGHGHEMIFGFALIVIAGYLAGPQPKSYIFTVMGLWLVARLSFWFAPIFLRTAKKWRNKSAGFVLVGLGIVAVGFHMVMQSDQSDGLSLRFLLEAVLLLSILMFYMGGRIIAPALAGHFQSQNRFLKDRVQPRFEGSILILLFSVLVLNLLTFTWIKPVMAALLLLSALLCVVRVLRWRPWWSYRRADLLAMLLGYSWIIVGWLGIALSLITANFPITKALHAITIGALGTLTFTVMSRTRSHRVLRDTNAKPFVFILALLITAAALLRLNPTWLGYSQSIFLAACCWSFAFIGLFVWLMWLNKIEKKVKRQGQLMQDK